MEHVDLIATGYEWECPNCEQVNIEPTKTDEVLMCTKCNEEYIPGNFFHCEG